jgi:hypothetical protein
MKIESTASATVFSEKILSPGIHQQVDYFNRKCALVQAWECTVSLITRE